MRQPTTCTQRETGDETTYNMYTEREVMKQHNMYTVRDRMTTYNMYMRERDR